MAPIDRRLYLDRLKDLDLHKGTTANTQEDDNNRPSLGLDPRQDSQLRRQCLPPAEAKAADELEEALKRLDLGSEGSCRDILDLMWQPRFREWHWLDDESDGYRGRGGGERNGIEDDRYAETNYDGLCWAGVFDAIDAVIEQYINNTPTDLLLASGTEVNLLDEVIIELLRWSKIVLVSNSQATLLYNSFDRIMSLLDSPHPRIIVSALDVLWNYNYSTTNIFKRVVPVANTQTTCMTEKIQMGTRMRLSWLSEGWENYNPSYDILCCCSQTATTNKSKSTNDMPPSQLDPQIVRSTAMSLPKTIDFIFDYQQPVTHEMKSLHCTLSKGQQGIDAAKELMEKLQNTVTDETVLTMLRYRLRHSLALLKGDSDMMLLFTAIRLCTVDITLQIKPHHTPPPCGNMGLDNTTRGDGIQQQRQQQQQQPLGWGPSGIGSGFLHMYLQTYPAFLGQLAALPFSAVSYSEMVKGVAVSRTLPIEVETVLLWSYRLMSTVLMEATLLGAGGQQLVVALASSSNLGYMTKMIQGSRDRLINALKECPVVEGSNIPPPQQQPRFTQSLTVCSECIDVMTNLITAMQYPNMMVTVANMSMILDFLIKLSTHEVALDWHHNTVLALVSCCKCLEIALEYSPSCFGILFRDLGGLDKLLDVVASLSKDCYECWKSADNTPDGVAGGEDYEKMLTLSNRRNELQAVLNLLKTSVHNIDPGVGMNLNEALSGHEVEEGDSNDLTSDAIRRRKEGFQKVMVRLYGDGGMAIGAQNIGYLSQLMHYICDNDPIIIPTVLGPNGELLKAIAKCLSPVRSSSFALGWTSTALSSFSLHNRGAELLRDLPNEENPLTLLVRMVMSGEGAGVRPISPLAEKVTSDLPMMLSQSLEDIVRNRNELAKPVVEAVFDGLRELMNWADEEWNKHHQRNGLLSAKLAPACRLLTSLLQTHSSMAKLLVMTDGKDEAKSAKPGQALCDHLIKLATHPSLPEGATILSPVVMSGSTPTTPTTPTTTAQTSAQQQQSNPHYHPIVATFRALENAFYNNLSPSHVGGASSSSSPSNELNIGDCLRPVATLVVDDAEKLHTSDGSSSSSNSDLMRSLAFGLRVFGLVHSPVKENTGGLFGNSSSTGGGSSSTRDYLSYSLLAVTDTVCKYAPQLLEELALANKDGQDERSVDITLKLNSPPNQVRRSRFMRDTIDWRKAVEMSATSGNNDDDIVQLRWTLWKVVKQFIEAVAKLANTPSGRIKKVHDMFFSSLSQKQISNAARIASVLLSNAFIDMTKRYHTLEEKAEAEGASRAKNRFITEMFDILVKCHVEDKSHHTRILSIDAMFKMGGFGKEFTDMIVDILRDPLTDETLSASVLGYCERITSIKRMENSSLTQPSLFPTIDKTASSNIQSFLKVDGYKLVSSLQVRFSSALLPLWRDDVWLAREAPPTGKESEEDTKQEPQQQQQQEQERRYVMSARACGSMVKLFTHAVEPDSRVIDVTPATTAATPSPGGGEDQHHPAEAHIAEMLRGAVVRRLPDGNTPMTAEQQRVEGSPKAATTGGGGDPKIDLDSSSAAHYAQKDNFIAVLKDRIPGIKNEGEEGQEALDLPMKLTPTEVRRNAEDVGKDFISRCVHLSKLGGQPGHCADVIARVAQNCNRVRLGVTNSEQQEEFREDETTRVQIHVRNLLHVVDVVSDEFIKEINAAAATADGEKSSPNALQCLSHVLAYLVNSTERVRATLWKDCKANRIIEGFCYYCEKKIKSNDDDKMMDATLWKNIMMDEAAMLGEATEEGGEGKEGQQQQAMLPGWLTEAFLTIEGLCEEPYLYTGSWDTLQIRLLSSVMRVLTAYEEDRGLMEDGSQKVVGVMVPSPDLTRAALEVMSLLVNREGNSVAVFGTSPGRLMSLLSLRRASSYPEITTMLASILSKLLENKQFIATVMELALMQLSKDNENDKKKKNKKKGATKKTHHHHNTGGGDASIKREASNGEQSGTQSSSSKGVVDHLAYKLSDILANPMMRSLMLKDPHTVQEVLLKDLVKKRIPVESSSTSRQDDEEEEGPKSSVMVALDQGVKEGFIKSDGRAATAYLSGVNTANFPYSILTVAAEFLLRVLDLLSSIRRNVDQDIDYRYPLAMSVEAAMYFFDTLVSKIQFAGASKAKADQSAASILLTPIATSNMLLNKPIRIEDFIITTVGDKLSSLPIGPGTNSKVSTTSNRVSYLKSSFHLISGCWTQLCASCTPDYTTNDKEEATGEDRVKVLEWYKGLAQRHMNEPFIKYSHKAIDKEAEELSWVMSTYRRFAILYAFLLKVSTMDAVDEVLGKDERQKLTEDCNGVLGSIMLHRPYSADLSEAVLACMEILTRPPRLQTAADGKKAEAGDKMDEEEEEDDEDSSPSVIYHFGPPAGFLLDEDSEVDDDEDDDDELIPTMIVEPVINDNDEAAASAGDEGSGSGAGGDSGEHEGDDNHEGDNDEEDWGDDDEVYDRLGEEDEDALLDELDDDDDDDEEQDMILQESEIHPAEAQPDELEEERDLQLEREQMENIDPDDVEEDDDDDDDTEGSSNGSEDDEDEDGGDDDEVDEGDMMDVLRDVVMGAAAAAPHSTSAPENSASAGGAPSGDQQQEEVSHGPSDTPLGNSGDASTGGSNSSSDTGSSSFDGEDDDVILEFDDGHHHHEDDMMDEDESSDDEEDDEEGEEGEGSDDDDDDDDAFPMFGFDGDIAPHRIRRRGGGGGEDGLMLPLLEDGPGRIFGIREFGPRRRAGLGAAGGGGQGSSADRGGIVNPNGVPPSAVLSAQSLLLPKPPRKVWSFTNPEDNMDKAGGGGRYSAVHPFFEGRQNNRMPPLVSRPHGDPSSYPQSEPGGLNTVDVISGVIEPPSSRALINILCNKVQTAVAEGLREEESVEATLPVTPKPNKRRSDSAQDGEGNAAASLPPKKKARRGSSRSRRSRGHHEGHDGQEEQSTQVAPTTLVADEGTQTADGTTEGVLTADTTEGVPTADTTERLPTATTAETAAQESQGPPADGNGDTQIATETVPAEGSGNADAAPEGVDTSQYPQACIDAANRMRVPIAEVVRRSGIDLSVLVELPPDLQREAILNAIGEMDEGVLNQLRIQYRQENPQADNNQNEGDGTTVGAGLVDVNETAEFLNALPPDLRRDALISMQFEDPGLMDALPVEMRAEALAASQQQARRHRRAATSSSAAAAQIGRPRRASSTLRLGGGRSAHQRQAEEQSRRLRAMGDSIRGSVDNIMHSTASSSSGGDATAAPRRIGSYLNNPFLDEPVGGGGEAVNFDDINVDDGTLVPGRRFDSLAQRLTNGARGHQQLAAIIREFESLAGSNDTFLFETNRGNRRSGSAITINGPGMDIDASWGAPAAFIGGRQGRRRQDLGGDWASTSSVRTAAQSPNGGVNTLARRGAVISPAALDSLNLGLQSPLRIVSGRGFPSSGTGGGQAIDRTWLQSPLQTEDIAHMYSNGTCSSLIPVGARSTCGQAGLADGAQNLLRLLFMRYQPLRPLVDKTIFNVCLEPKLEDAVLQALVQALLSLACSSNRRHGHSVHGWSFVVEGDDGSIGKATTGASSSDDENETFPPWYLYEPPMISPPTARSGTSIPDANTSSSAATSSSAVTASPTVRALARSVGCGRVLNAISFLVSTIPRTRQWFASPSMTNNALLQRTSSTISKTVSSPSPKRASTSGVKRRRSSLTTAESDVTEVRRSRRLLSRTESATTDPSEGSGSARKLQRTKSVGGKEAGKSTVLPGEAEMGSGPSAAAGTSHSQQKANRSSQPILVAPVNVVVQLLGSPLLRSSPAHTLFLVTVLVSMLTPPTHTGKTNTHHTSHNTTPALPPPPPPPVTTTNTTVTATTQPTASTSTATAEVPKSGASNNASSSSPKKAAKTTNDIIRMHVRHLQRAVSGSSVSALCAFLANDNPISGCQVNSTELDKALAKTSSLIQALAGTGDRHKMVIRKQLLIHVRQLSNKVSSMLMDLAEGRASLSPEEHPEQESTIRDTSSGTLLMTSKRLLRVVQCWSDALLPKGNTLTPEAEEEKEKEFNEFLVEAHVEDLWPGLDKALTKYDNDPKVLESQLASVSRAQAALQARRENEERHRQQQQQYARSTTRNPISPHHDSLDRVERPERAQPSQQQEQGGSPGQRSTNRHLPSGLTSLLPIIELYLIAMLPTKSDRLKVASARRGMANNNGATSPRAGGFPKTPSASSKAADSSTAPRPELDQDPRHQELSRQARAVASFCESHRRPLNALIKNQPSLLLRALNPIVYAAPQALDFDNKRQFFRSKLKEQSRRAGHMSGPPIRLHVRRHEVFVDSYHQLQHRKKSEMMNKIIVQFVGEEGVDAGGLVREWFGILAREIFNPNYALFLPANGRPSTFLINPASSVNPDHLSFFRFCGRIIGKAIYENQRLDCYFVRSFYKHMLGRPVTWHDMEAMDPDYYRNLKWILECQDDEMLKALDLTFTIEESDFGKTNVVELIPNGSNIPVTQQNKHEYVQKVCEHKMTSGIQDQLNAFLEGFHELVPSDLVGTLFDDKELELLIAGLPTIDVEDLKRNTEYVNYSSQDPQIKWFWKCLEEDFTEDEMAWFLQFVTGSTQVPLEGFQALTGMRGPQKFSIHKAPGDKTRLPSAHTCFNQLDLPDYDTEEVLKTKLKQAVCEAHEGFGFV